MYFEHEVVVSMLIRSPREDVTKEDVQTIFETDEWEYEITKSQLVTPVDKVIEIRDRISKYGLRPYRYDGTPEFAMELLSEVIQSLTDWQEEYEEYGIHLAGR